jgi:hypothetical protein
MEELGSRKGLKYLAKLLIRTLKKKKFDSSKYLTEEIEEKLMKGKKLSKNVLFDLKQGASTGIQKYSKAHV